MKAPKYEKELSFLVPYLFDEETRHSNIASPPSTQQDVASPPSLPSVDSGSDIDEIESAAEQQSQLVGQSTSSLSTSSTINRRKRKYPQQALSAAVVLREYLDKKEIDIREKKNPACDSYRKDPLTEFFLTMADTVKSFPIRDQVQIKAKIFEIVNTVEVKLANNEANDNEERRSHNTGNISYNIISTAPSLPVSQVQDQTEISQNNILVVPQDIIPQESSINYNRQYNIPVQRTYINLSSQTQH